ncbi:MAG: DNA alkylation repair protein [Candidatus Paceibacterota bacterium]|jgi:3-methyladenine DNA glycosylase AlkD|nr:DNA alkylation repair protein [Candidatus Paceibacterota bacterium]
MINFTELQKEIRSHADPQKAALLMRFFKTGKGEYADGDLFLGIMVPVQRVIAKKFSDLSISDVEKLLHSKYHEERLIALFILIHQFEKGDAETKKKIFSLYLANTMHINNWDLIDLSAPKIIGEYLWKTGSETRVRRDISLLKKIARSENLWERRIAVLATFQYIKYNSFVESLEIAEILVHDRHDLIHKAVGWMLREIGKRDQSVEEEFLKKHAGNMPRTMLRYAIERFPEEKRKEFLCSSSRKSIKL